ncbi:Protein-lysine N-methyltransferase EFM4 [Paramyrothecium foliicola]|nr:Protein-lysine N-methyltransferase EFM4 [Paramyrothecium foliicola]
MATDRPAHLEPSELGTREYWDKLYTTELSNHAADPSDIGTCWFDDSDAEAKVVQLLSDLADPDSASSHAEVGTPAGSSIELSKAATTFLDLGCGNGSLLLALRDDGWAGRMLGVDYSAQSVSLARQVASQRQQDAEDEEDGKDGKKDRNLGELPPVDFREWDVVAGPLSDALDSSPAAAEGTSGDDCRTREWDVVLDKGTFDAISLSDETDAQGRRLCEAYRDRVWRLVRPGGGLFVITSCNWTEAELRRWFEGVGGEAPDGNGPAAAAAAPPSAGLQVAARVQYRTFSFGGVKGQTISTLCFRRP